MTVNFAQLIYSDINAMAPAVKVISQFKPQLDF